MCAGKTRRPLFAELPIVCPSVFTLEVVLNGLTKGELHTRRVLSLLKGNLILAQEQWRKHQRTARCPPRRDRRDSRLRTLPDSANSFWRK